MYAAVVGCHETFTLVFSIKLNPWISHMIHQFCNEIHPHSLVCKYRISAIRRRPRLVAALEL